MADIIEIEIGRKLRSNLANPFIEEFEAAQDESAVIIKESYQDAILDVKAYRTGAFHRSPIVTTPSRYEGGRVIDIDSDYYRDPKVAAERPQGIGDIIERGALGRLGRYPARLGLERADREIERTLKAHARKAIKVIEEGG